MIKKLAFRNMCRNLRDYGVYFITLLFGVSIFYMFNSIYAQKDMMSVTESVNSAMTALRQILSYISVFVSIVLGGLIVYANNYFIRRRKKELGIYLILGMVKREIALILTLETSIMAISALGVGLLLGIFGSQFMSFFTAQIFDADMTNFTFVFSFDAAIKCVIYFAIIFFIVAVFNVINLNKVKLIELIYGGRKNEKIRLKSLKVSLCLFVISILLLGFAYFLIITNGILELNLKFTASIILGISGTLLFFFSFSGFLIILIQKKKKVYFKGLNMFVTRQLSSKLNTNFLSLSVVCLTLFLVISIFSAGYSIQRIVSKSLKESTSYNFSMVADNVDTPIWNELPENIKMEITSKAEVKTYHLGESFKYKNLNIDLSNINSRLPELSLTFITTSDFNKLCELQDKKELKLKDNEYITVSYGEKFDELSAKILENKSVIQLENTNLYPVECIKNTQISNVDSASIYFVVPDKYDNYLKKNKSNKSNYLNLNTDNSTSEHKVNELLRNLSTESNRPFLYYVSRMDEYTDSITVKAIISFLAIYLGIVFMICCAAILAIQQLSEATDNRERYLLLQKLGTEKSMINKAIFRQVLCYFIFPLFLAAAHSIVGLIVVYDVIEKIGDTGIVKNLVVTGGFVLSIYAAYFLTTYIGCKNVVYKK